VLLDELSRLQSLVDDLLLLAGVAGFRSPSTPPIHP